MYIKKILWAIALIGLVIFGIFAYYQTRGNTEFTLLPGYGLGTIFFAFPATDYPFR